MNGENPAPRWTDQHRARRDDQSRRSKCNDEKIPAPRTDNLKSNKCDIDGGKDAFVAHEDVFRDSLFSQRRRMRVTSHRAENSQESIATESESDVTQLSYY